MMRWPKSRAPDPIDPQGRRIIGLTIEDGHPILAPEGHSLLLSANGGGKTRRGAMPWLFSFLSSSPKDAILIADSKNGEVSIQAAKMAADMGRKVAVIDDMGIWPELAPYRVSINPFGAAVSAYRRDPRDVLFATETINAALIPEPAGGDAKNKYFRDAPRDLLEFVQNTLLKRNPEATTPGATSVIVNDPDLLRSYAEIEAEEGEPMLMSQAKNLLEMSGHEHWPQHLKEAQRAIKLFGPGTRLHEVGAEATLTYEDLIREGYVIFLAGPQAYMNRLGNYYALHIMGFCDALYHGAGVLRAVCDEFTNTPLKSLVESLTTLRAFGTQIHIIAQSRSEIIRRFGELECRTIEENCIVKLWFGFSSFEEAQRLSKAMGDEFAVATALGGDSDGLKTSTNLSLTKQSHMTPAELMAMPSDQGLAHIKGVGFVRFRTLGQENIAPYCHLIAPNPLEGGRLLPDPKITLVTPNITGGPS